MNEKSFGKWLETLGEAWTTKNPELIGTICAENIQYYEHPFEEPRVGRQAVIDEWQNVPVSQKDVVFDFDIVSISKNIGIAHWKASYTNIVSNVRVNLDGIFTVELDSNGLCSEFHMWWVEKTR